MTLPPRAARAATRTSASEWSDTCDATWPTSPLAAIPASCTRSPTTPPLPRHDARDRRGLARCGVDGAGLASGGHVWGVRPRAAGSPSIRRSARCSTTGVALRVRIPQQPAYSILCEDEQLGARVRRRLRLLGRAGVDGHCARRHRGRRALDVPLRALCRALRWSAHRSAGGVRPSSSCARCSRTSPGPRRRRLPAASTEGTASPTGTSSRSCRA